MTVTWNFRDSRICSTPVLRSEHPHGIYPLVQHVQLAHRADKKSPILGVVYYRSWKECVAVVRSITKRYFLIKSTILILKFEHPHDICLLVKHVNIVYWAGWKWFILGVFYYRSWTECVVMVRSITKRSIFIYSTHLGHEVYTRTQIKHHILSRINFIYELPQSGVFLLYFSDDAI